MSHIIFNTFQKHKTTNTDGHVTRLLLGASLGPQVKDHTTWLLPGASLSSQIKDQTTLFLPGVSLDPQVSCVTTRSFVRPTGRRHPAG